MSIDIEGKDYDVVMDIDFERYYIKNISIEYLHLNKKQKKKLISKLIQNGYSYNGFGVDHNNIDWLFTKKKSKWNDFISRIFPYIHRIHYKRLNKIIKKNMRNINFFCLTLNANHENLLKNYHTYQLGLGNKKFSNNFLNDKNGFNISKKNPYYGEYTFHYWIWKNYLDEIKTDWVGFCQYRKFFSRKQKFKNLMNLDSMI